MKFGQHMDVDDPKDDLEGQGHRSKVKVTRSKKKTFQVPYDHLTDNLGGQGSQGVTFEGHISTLNVKVTRSKMLFHVPTLTPYKTVFYKYL